MGKGPGVRADGLSEPRKSILGFRSKDPKLKRILEEDARHSKAAYEKPRENQKKNVILYCRSSV